MKRSQIKGWVEARVDEPGLCIYHRVGEDDWASTATAFYRGKLANLTAVTSAKTAEVSRGHVAHAVGNCYFKRYLHRDWADPIKDMFRDSRARRALRNEQDASAQGFQLPQSLCLIERRRVGVLSYCALINRAIDDARILRDWLTDPALGMTGSAATRESLLVAFAYELGRWHAAGWHHGDLRLGNVLCKRDDPFSFYWLDNERNKQYAKLPMRMRIHNLMRINFEPCGVSNAERMRFWHAYLETADLVEQQEKDVMKAVSRQTYDRRAKYGWA